MKQIIEIEVPNGKKAVWKDGKVVFEDIKPPLPKTWEEFCEQSEVKRGEYYLEIDCSILEVGKGERHKKTDRNILPSKQAAKQHLALMQLHQLRDCYRQGWIPDYTNDSKKWCIITNKGILSIDYGLNYSTFLSFQTIEIAEEFLNNFRNLIEQAKDLI